MTLVSLSTDRLAEFLEDNADLIFGIDHQREMFDLILLGLG